MNPDNLPISLPLKNGHHDILEKFSGLVSIEGKRCLCIGYDEAQLRDLILKYNPRGVTLLTLWDEHKDSNVDGFEVVIGDICERTAFNDDEFDFVITFSVLEHLSDLERAFIEIKRVLKPEGYFASLFGPVWSCNVGHHIYANPGHPLFDFFQWRLPSHIHLLSSLDEIFEYYRGKGATEGELRSVEEWFFKTNIINRVFFEDYIKLFHKHFYYIASLAMYSEVSADVLSMLRRKYPPYQDFATYGGAYLLKNLVV